jgi:hypothetical protein
MAKNRLHLGGISHATARVPKVCRNAWAEVLASCTRSSMLKSPSATSAALGRSIVSSSTSREWWPNDWIRLISAEDRATGSRSSTRITVVPRRLVSDEMSRQPEGPCEWFSTALPFIALTSTEIRVDIGSAWIGTVLRLRSLDQWLYLTYRNSDRTSLTIARSYENSPAHSTTVRTEDAESYSREIPVPLSCHWQLE